MTNDARASCRTKCDESNNPKGSNAAEKSPIGLDATTPDSSSVRRSARETSSKKNMNPSPLSTRKSKRLEERNPVTPPVKKSERAKKQSVPSPLRRSERGKKQISSSSSGSKEPDKSLASLTMKKKQKKEKSVKQLTLETEKVSNDVKLDKVESLKGHIRNYKKLFKQKTNKGHCEKLQETDELPQECGSNNGGGASKSVDGDNDECSQQRAEKSREEYVGRGSGKTSEESDSTATKTAKETLEKNTKLEPSYPSQEPALAEGSHQSEDADCLEGFNNGDCALRSSWKMISKQLKNVAERVQDDLQPALVGSVLNKRTSDDEIGLGDGHKGMPSKRKRSSVDIDSDAADMVLSKDICSSVAGDVSLSPDERNNFMETCLSCFKRQRLNLDSEQQECCSCSTKLSQDIRGTSLVKDRVETEAGVTPGYAEDCFISTDVQLDGDQNRCFICKLGGKLLCCDGKGCKRSYHLSCLDPPLKEVPIGVWHCLACIRKKIELGVHSVSEGVESIWDAREVEVSVENGLQKQNEFFVKYKGLAHAHNRWVPESQLVVEAPTLVTKFNRRTQVKRWKKEWVTPHRLLQKRLIMSPKQNDEYSRGQAGNIPDCCYEWLVKWRGLDYEHATWELENTSFMSSPEVQSLMRDYENRHEKANGAQHSCGMDEKLELKKSKPDKLSQLTAGTGDIMLPNHLDFVNNLREFWHKRHNAVVIDDQERIMKVISFVLSLSPNVSSPFLIITTSAALSSWDEEFVRLAPTLYAVVYHGNKDVRKSIRAVEFAEEGGCVMFQVLVTSPEIISEDLNVFESKTWEAIIVDECQQARIYSHFKQIEVLRTDMRLLLVNGQLKDGTTEHLLSLLDCQSDLNGNGGMVTNSSLKTGTLKERLSKYIAISKSDSSRFVEYWVPAQISTMQLEQYCATLLSNSLSLCSSSKNDPVGALRNIIVSTQKCCNHPYILDPSLQISLMKDNKEVNILDVGIKASGKLQLLDEMLLEIRNRSLRVIVLFQSSGGSGKDNIGDILDDFVRQRFGQDSYERIDKGISVLRKQAALNNFNNQKERFVFLLEARACLPSIKLSSVDNVIIYCSDWNPVNDIRNLQKVTIESQLEQIKVFRLYSSCTVEERVLIFAKQDKNLDSNLQSISRGSSHMLLMWGAPHLFKKLANFHSSNFPASYGRALFEQSLCEDVLQEFLTILLSNGKYNRTSNSKILEVKQNKGSYNSNISLPGELESQLMDEELPHIFWKKLLEGKKPPWKYSSGSSQRNRKRVQHFDDVPKKPEGYSDEVAKKRKKVVNNNMEGAAHHISPSPPVPISSPNKRHANNLSEIKKVKVNERVHLDEAQKSLHLFLKPKIAKLCEILQLPEDVKGMVESFLEYVMNNHHVSREPASLLQAFQLSLCWTAASLLKYKLDHKESLALANKHLNLGCKKEEVDYVYSMLRCLKRMFLVHLGKSEMSLEVSQISAKDLRKDRLHTKLSQPMISNQQKFKLDVENTSSGPELSEDPVLSQLGLAQKDFSKSIKKVENKCHKLMRKLLMKQQEEKEEFEKKYEEQKAQLENKRKTEAAVIRLHSSMRIDKLKLLDMEYAKKFEELRNTMEKELQTLEAAQLAARNTLQKRKVHWVEGVKSWAEVELMNKTRSNGTKHNQEKADLNSCSKEQFPEGVLCVSDGELPPEFPETVSSNYDEEDIVPVVLPTSKQILSQVTSSRPDMEFPLQVSSSQARIPDADITCAAPNEVVKGLETSKQQGGEAVANKNICDDHHQSSDKTGDNGQNGEAASGVAEIAGAEVLPNDKAVKQQGEKIQADKILSNHDCQSSDKSAEVDLQNQGIPSKDTGSGEVEGVSNSKGNNGISSVASSSSTRADQREGVIPSAECETVSEEAATVVLANSSGGFQQDGMVCIREGDPLGLSHVNSTTMQQGTALSQGSTMPLHQVLQNECPRQEEAAQAGENENVLQQVIRSTNDERILEHSLRLQSLVSAGSSDVIMNLPSTSGVEHQPSIDGHITSNTAVLSIPPPPVNNQMQVDNQVVLQPVRPPSQDLPGEIPIGGAGTHALDMNNVPIASGLGSNSPVLPVRTPLPLCHDPLQNELDRIRKEIDQFTNIYEEAKLLMKSDCEKEVEEVVAQIRRKYNIKLQEMESEFLLKKKELDSNHNKVLMNKILAEAFRSKCMDVKGSTAIGTKQDISSGLMHQLHQVTSPAIAHRPPIVTSITSTGPLASGPQNTAAPVAPASQPNAPQPPQPARHAASLFSGTSSRPPQISSISATGNPLSGTEIRAPAPHLQPFRSSTPMPAASPLNLSHGMPIQRLPSNPSGNTLRVSPVTSQVLHSMQQHQSAGQIRAHQPPPTILSTPEVTASVDNQTGTNPRVSPLQSDFITNPSLPSELPNCTRVNPTNSSDVVCLSDDE